MDSEHPVTSPTPSSTAFDGYVVGIGASAGGLEALENFFHFCRPDTGAVFVVIQHLSPDHKSMMSNLLARHTKMPVVLAEHRMPVLANHVYLIPPGSLMRIAEGQLHLSPKSPHQLTLPIDIFFASLADAYGERGVGIVLSGTGSDGARGAVAINAAGGFLLAQSPENAKFDGMPRSAIGTGIVDDILPADQLATRLLSHIEGAHEVHVERPARLERSTFLGPEDVLSAILQLLLEAGGIDFQDYKPATVMRRIERRMQVRHIVDLEDYLDLLVQDRTEVFTLRRELLIAVTSFFRDAEAFAAVTETVISPIVAKTQTGDTVRVWAAGVSTGEEAYSLAILFLEAFERERRWPTLKIFGTDVNPQNIEHAAAGQYPESAAAELTPERLERYFQKTGNSYTVKTDLRQCVVFARHNLLADPPFTRMDLVSCRNTLIYLQPEAQDRALRRLQYALKPEGFLFLGTSESLSGTAAGITTVNPKQKIFRRTGAGIPLLFDGVARRSSYTDLGPSRDSRKPKRTLSDGNLIDAGLTALIEAYAPPAILVNEQQEAVHLFGDVQPYIRVRQGSASLALNRILPDTIVPVAAALLFKATKDSEKLVSDVLPIQDTFGRTRQVRLFARPLSAGTDERLTLLCFEEQAERDSQQAAQAIDVDAETMERVHILERELGATRESLQATIEELETANEELQATNEELMASNEELQSSNEELQSVNEELNTVNAEYQEKVVILNRINADLDSMSKAVGVATVFVDNDMNLTRYSPDAVSIFKLRDSDIGRPLDDIAHRLKYPNLIDDMRLTLATERMHEREVSSVDGKLYLARVLPYGVPSATERGVVATFVDVSSVRDLQRLQAVLDALPEHIAVLETDGAIAMVNAAWRRFAIANGDPELRHSGPGSNYFEACRTGKDEDGTIADRALRGVKSVLEGSQALFMLQYPCHSPTEERWFVMYAAPIVGRDFGAVVSHINISAWYRGSDGPDGAHA